MDSLHIAHISDLHFSSGADAKATHCHSIELLQAAEEKIRELDPSLLIISGDVSNNGDRESLLRAHEWIVSDFGIGDGRRTGLRFKSEQIGIIPGNHDAWNSGRGGPARVRWQRSLDNYNDIFSTHKIPSTGCYHRWLECGDLSVYIVFIDSSYLGDLESYGGNDLISRIARGKISIEQCETLLNWEELGVAGKLEDPASSSLIPADRFRRSLKILVMHHYLFEPPGQSDDYFMAVGHRDTVVRNVLMADFDIVLCGHKHQPDFRVRAFADNFDARAKKRLILNSFRRCLGLHAIPLEYRSDRGRYLSKHIQIFLQLFRRSRQTNSVEDMIELFSMALENPHNFATQAANILSSIRDGEGPIASRDELRDLKNVLCSRFSKNERKQLSIAVKATLHFTLSGLGHRPLLQVLGGSTTKSIGVNSPVRGLNSYRVTLEGEKKGIRFKMDRYSWDTERREFRPECSQSLLFAHNRRAPVRAET